MRLVLATELKIYQSWVRTVSDKKYRLVWELARSNVLNRHSLELKEEFEKLVSQFIEKGDKDE